MSSPLFDEEIGISLRHLTAEILHMVYATGSVS